LLRVGNGCAPESRAPIACDGPGSCPASDSQQYSAKERAPTKREIVVSPLDLEATEQDRTVQPKDQREREHAVDQDDEIRLKRKLIICSASAGESARLAREFQAMWLRFEDARRLAVKYLHLFVSWRRSFALPYTPRDCNCRLPRIACANRIVLLTIALTKFV
jgi:hypothetical protein